MKSKIKSMIAYGDGLMMTGRYTSDATWIPSKKLIANFLDKQKSLTDEPYPLASTIAFNETYMDIVDWSYHKLGILEVIFLFLMIYPAFISLPMIRDFAEDPWPDEVYTGGLLVLIFVQSISLLFFLWFGRILLRTFTGCTHYPVRLDRKRQMVHIFRHNGEGGVSSYPWSDINFGLSGGGADQRGFPTGVIIGYIQLPNGNFDYFRLGVMWPNDEGMSSQWEYYRRYMEEGPDCIPEPEILLPIDGKREAFRLGAQFCWFFGGPDVALAIFLSPLTVPGSLLRWLIMHVTRRLPRWPQHIIDQCPVSPLDKYAYKSRKSPEASYDLAFFLTVIVLALDAALLYWFIDFLHQPGYH